GEAPVRGGLVMAGLLEGMVVLVTGAAAGIGRASALRFADEGAVAIVVADVDETGGRATVEESRRRGRDGAFGRWHVAGYGQVAAAVDLALSRFGRLDGAYNNAGLGHGQAPIAEIDQAGWDRTVAVNLTGTWHCMKHELLAMVELGSGAIVNQS